jgi:predicted membrane protein
MNACDKRGGGMFAMLLILMGVLLFLENVGLIPSWSMADFWPVWMIIWGVFMIDRTRNLIAVIWSGGLIVSGILVILGNLHILHISVSIIGPVMLIALGLILLVAPGHVRQLGEQWRGDAGARWRARQELRDQIRSSIGNTMRIFRGNSLHEDVVFSSVTRRIQTQQFEGGRVTAVFGSIQLDLVEAVMASTNGGARLKADAVFGGIEIIVPRTWKVDMRSTAVFGGCDDRTLPPRPELGIEPPKLLITGSAVFGGVTVRN